MLYPLSYGRILGEPSGPAIELEKQMTSGPEGTRWSSRALEGTRTPNLLIRSQMLYPLSYERNNDSLGLS